MSKAGGNMGLQQTSLGRSQLEVCRIGLGGEYEISTDDVRYALDRGINLIWWDKAWPKMTAALQTLTKSQRGNIIIAAGSESRTIKGFEMALNIHTEALKTDYIDLFICYYINTWEEMELLQSNVGALNALREAREKGTIRATAFTAHDRPLAARIAATGAFDVAILRYNAAHVGAESEVFPIIQEQQMGLCIYTPTRWGQLLEKPQGWNSSPPKPHELFRFTLEHPAVNLAFTAPKNRNELDQNLKAVENDYELSPERLDELRAYGQLFREDMGL